MADDFLQGVQVGANLFSQAEQIRQTREKMAREMMASRALEELRRQQLEVQRLSQLNTLQRLGIEQLRAQKLYEAEQARIGREEALQKLRDEFAKEIDEAKDKDQLFKVLAKAAVQLNSPGVLGNLVSAFKEKDNTVPPSVQAEVWRALVSQSQKAVDQYSEQLNSLNAQLSALKRNPKAKPEQVSDLERQLKAVEGNLKSEQVRLQSLLNAANQFLPQTTGVGAEAESGLGGMGNAQGGEASPQPVPEFTAGGWMGQFMLPSVPQIAPTSLPAFGETLWGDVGQSRPEKTNTVSNLYRFGPAEAPFDIPNSPLRPAKKYNVIRNKKGDLEVKEAE